MPHAAKTVRAKLMAAEARLKAVAARLSAARSRLGNTYNVIEITELFQPGHGLAVPEKSLKQRLL